MSVTRVLIVDDEPDMLENYARILGRVGYQCFTTTEPGKALALLEEERPEIGRASCRERVYVLV